jgi:hypothetical protein
MSLAPILSLAEVHVTASLSQHFTAYVGIDWADTKHYICLQGGNEDHRQFDCIPYEVDCIDEWARHCTDASVALSQYLWSWPKDQLSQPC